MTGTEGVVMYHGSFLIYRNYLSCSGCLVVVTNYFLGIIVAGFCKKYGL